MSRIGKNPIQIPSGVNVDLKNQNITITGSKGSLSLRYEKVISINHLDNELLVSRSGDEKFQKALHGTTRQLIQNMVEGVSYGFSKELELIGVGYQASVQGNRLKLQLGFSHDIFDVPPSINISAERTSIKVEGIDKQLVGIVAAKIRSFRPPEPYKGKGLDIKENMCDQNKGKQ